jgi:NCAIR mutase (PurE)-related protein
VVKSSLAKKQGYNKKIATTTERLQSRKNMNEQELKKLLTQVRDKTLPIGEAVDQLSHLPAETIRSAQLDHQRQLRTGLPEAVFGENKTAAHLLEILSALLRQKTTVLATRVSPDKAGEVMHNLDGLTYHDTARVLTGNDRYIPEECGRGTVVIVTAGTSDMPVAEETRIALERFGHTWLQRPARHAQQLLPRSGSR